MKTIEQKGMYAKFPRSGKDVSYTHYCPGCGHGIINKLIAEACGKRARLWKLPKLFMKAAAKVGDVLHLPLNTERLEKLTEDSFVDNSELKKLLGWKRMPIAAEDGMRLTLKSFW